ncbi:hypothetical protein ACSC95_19150 [Burkholderia vietnamiensis]
MKKILFAALFAPLMALAQTYPSPTFSSLTLQNPLAQTSGGTGTTAATGTGAVVYATSPTISNPVITGAITGGVYSFTTGTMTSSAESSTFSPLTTVNLYPSATTDKSDFVISQNNPGSHTGNSNSAFAISSSPVGSGVNGPVTADYGASISVIKQNFLTSSALGEIDGLQIVTRQGQDDTDGILINAGGVAGYMGAMETVTNQFQATTGNILQGIDTQLGYIETGLTGTPNSGGLALISTVGTFNNGLLIQSQGTSGYTSAIQVNANNGGSQTFNLTPGGLMTLGASGSQKTFRVQSNTFGILNNAQNTQLLALDDSGNLSTTGSGTFANISSAAVTASGQSQFTNSTASTSTSTGAVTITGGLGVGGAINSGSISTGNLTASGTVSGAGFTSLLSPYAPLASPALTGTPTAPTASSSTNTTLIATTAMVQSVLPAGFVSYTPTISASSGSYTSASATGGYMRLGKLVCLQATASITTVGTGTTTVLSLPVTAASTNSGMQVLAGRENALTGKMLQAAIVSGGSSMVITDYANASAAANGASEVISGCYISQ